MENLDPEKLLEARALMRSASAHPEDAERIAREIMEQLGVDYLKEVIKEQEQEMKDIANMAKPNRAQRRKIIKKGLLK